MRSPRMRLKCLWLKFTKMVIISEGGSGTNFYRPAEMLSFAGSTAAVGAHVAGAADVGRQFRPVEPLPEGAEMEVMLLRMFARAGSAHDGSRVLTPAHQSKAPGCG